MSKRASDVLMFANHITRVFEKTGAGNRTEAAVFATRHGLVELR